jgi:hypothetical protein
MLQERNQDQEPVAVAIDLNAKALAVANVVLEEEVAIEEVFQGQNVNVDLISQVHSLEIATVQDLLKETMTAQDLLKEMIEHQVSISHQKILTRTSLRKEKINFHIV